MSKTQKLNIFPYHCCILLRDRKKYSKRACYMLPDLFAFANYADVVNFDLKSI